ncbi:MAG: hypothetical protein ACSHW7_11180 [Patiriisocius sp.]|uniref:hypothetical protein n=1 Tax=Patiriisocius sp. TaxID=2822396 RepID=UPI003EF8F350
MNSKLSLSILLLCLFTLTLIQAQVGIGTTTPEGILDIKSSIYGVVYPSAALQATNLQAPVVNPLAGNLAVGTTIFNTATTNNGSNDVKPGIYSWNGIQWINHFDKKETTLFKQTTELRTSSNVGFQGVPGLDNVASNTFTPKFSGIYKIELRGYYGGGQVVTDRGIHTVTAKGIYRLAFNGTNYDIQTKSYSTYHPNADHSTQMEDNWVETVLIKYVSLIAGTSYSFDLSFDQTSTQSTRGFRSSGNLFSGRGHLGSEIKCSVEFTYLN